MLLTGTEAGLVASALEEGLSLTTAVGAIDPAKKARVNEIAAAAGLRFEGDLVAAVLRGIEGAHSTARSVDTIWTMPGHVAQGGGLTTSLVSLIKGARQSVVCSTFNVQKTSGLWKALHETARHPGVSLRAYIDAEANAGGSGPSATETAQWLAPGVVLQTRLFEGKPVRNHAKFLSVDHRFVVVTSANFSWSAEFGNVELGVRIDDAGLAERIEDEMRVAERYLYVVVDP
ncbi:DISARM system phospholipase D-like protein DrmC [Cellulosimicrobium cellulans]|uniref:DISARM system phospholipase D-like protein DrmC n=1 Tax=Cellulosimicrobium cellulans TaxID=1710 RepID=UPI0020977044|nr:DISARM system phospholipase D-like protein DrmC [Cellulosimicrobium cellulans]MCO7271577.1 DISARM system phospholipase D-like protein DrmC [Cellulosimicrobium cellulans]